MRYRVDAGNHLVEVSSDWDSFALANGGSRALAHQVVGRPLADFVHGDATRMFVFSALEAARQRCGPMALPYRCDAPSLQRRFEMVLQSHPDGPVDIEHRLVWQQARHMPITAPADRPQAPHWRCSQCLGVRLAGQQAWREPEAPTGDPLGWDVCPPCALRLFDAARTGSVAAVRD